MGQLFFDGFCLVMKMIILFGVIHLRFSFFTKCFIYQGKQTISFKNFLPRPTKEIKRIQITSREMYPEDI